MRLSETLCEAFCVQVSHEYRNQMIYTQVASYFDKLQLTNIAKYFYTQAQHEKEHGDKFVQYINSRVGGNFHYVPIREFEHFDSVESIAENYLKVEQDTTTSIESLYGLAFEEGSYIDLSFIMGFLTEQVEEEDSAEKFKLNILNCGDLVLFDRNFGG
jgi:ferritin